MSRFQHMTDLNADFDFFLLVTDILSVYHAAISTQCGGLGLAGRTIIQLLQNNILLFFYCLGCICLRHVLKLSSNLVCNAVSSILAYFQSLAMLLANFKVNFPVNRCTIFVEMAQKTILLVVWENF